MTRFASLALVVLVLVAFAVTPAVAAQKIWSLSVGTTLNPTESDTSQTISTSGYDNLTFFLAYEGDSTTVTIQGSTDGSAWYTISSLLANGVDGTAAIQLFGPVVQTGIGTAAKSTLSEFIVPPLNYTRVILYNHDAAGTDTLGSIVARLSSTR